MTNQELWPKKAKMYLHADKESNWELGEELGLTEEAIRENFRFALYEVILDLEVNQDGTYKILNVKE